MSGQQEGEDVLEATDRDDGITVAIDAAEQTVTLAGPASVTAYRTALREVLYSNRSAAATGDRVVRVLVTDGPSVSAPDSRTITLGVRAPESAGCAGDHRCRARRRHPDGDDGRLDRQRADDAQPAVAALHRQRDRLHRHRRRDRPAPTRRPPPTSTCGCACSSSPTT